MGHNRNFKKLQNAPNYIKMKDLKDGYSYKIYAQNAYAGIWIESLKGFLIARYKCGEKPYLFVEYHWDLEEGGTAKPLELIEKCPFEIGKDLWNLPPDKKQAVLKYLEELERKHPIIPGYDSVQERKRAAINFKKRLESNRKGEKSRKPPIWKLLKKFSN